MEIAFQIAGMANEMTLVKWHKMNEWTRIFRDKEKNGLALTEGLICGLEDEFGQMDLGAG